MKYMKFISFELRIETISAVVFHHWKDHLRWNNYFLFNYAYKGGHLRPFKYISVSPDLVISN